MARKRKSDPAVGKTAKIPAAKTRNLGSKPSAQRKNAKKAERKEATSE